MDSAVITGAFALGGVVVGGGLDWARASLAARQAAAAERDRLVAALDTACIGLMTEAVTWRALDAPGSKLRQLVFGLLGELPELPASASPAALSATRSDAGYALMRWVGKATAGSLGHQTPVALTQSMRATLMPLRAEITTMAVRLSMLGDERIKDATLRISVAAGALLEHITEAEAHYTKHGEEMQAALGQLRRARDAAEAHWWRPRSMRRRIKAG